MYIKQIIKIKNMDTVWTDRSVNKLQNKQILTIVNISK